MDRIPLSIYLLKKNAVLGSWRIFQESFESGSLTEANLKIDGIEAKLWIGSSTPGTVPEWVQEFAPLAGLSPKTFSNISVQGALAFAIDGKGVLMTFGHAWRRVDTSCVVPNFGLRCVLNLCGDKELRAIKHDRISHDFVQTMVQSPEQAGIYRFGFDIEQDLLRGVRAGVSASKGFGSSISGSDAFKFSYSKGTSLISAARKLIRVYGKQNYKNSFGWVDDISHIRDDAPLINRLQSQLASELSTGAGGWSLCLPEFEEWDSYDAFAYGRVTTAAALSSLSTASWLHHMRGRGVTTINATHLDSEKVTALQSANRTIRKSWPVGHCIYGNLNLNGEDFLLHGGQWYRLGNDFVGKVDRQLHILLQPTVGNVLPPSRISELEDTYNKRVARGSKREIILLDKKNIMHGGGHSRIELCDLLSKSLKMYCVKRWTSSSGISHLCQQALVAARLVRSDQEFSKKVEKKLKGSHRAAWIRARSLNNRPEVVLVLMGAGPVGTLPLFSRITLADAAKKLLSMGYSVSYTSV